MRSYLRLGIAQVAIGAAAIFARYALLGAAPLAVAALRLLIAACAMFAIARGLRPIAPQREFAFALAGVALALHFAAWIASLEYTSIAISTLLVTTTPLWTELYDSTRTRQRPTNDFLFALTIAFVGVALIATHRSGRPPATGHELLGDALALGGSVAIGAYLLIVRDAAVAADGARLTTRQIVLRTYAWAAAALVSAAGFAHQTPPIPGNGVAWAGIFAMALVSQLLGHTALNASLATFSPSVVALSTLCEPIVAAALAAIVFHESLHWTTLAGGVLVIGAVAVVLRRAEGSSEKMTTT